MFYCGTAELCITPALGMSIPGYFEDRRVSGVKDDLFAKAIFLESGAQQAIVIACDTINLDREDVEAIRKKVCARLDLPEEAIIVHATHTHTGGPTWEGFSVLRDAAYLEKLTTAAAQAALQAYENRKIAKFGAKTGSVSDITFIRRFYRPDGSVVTNPHPDDLNITGTEGEPDETFTLFKITDEADQPIVFWSNFGLHLDTVAGTEISADYAGVLARKVHEHFGGNVMSLFMTGPCGNLNHLNRKNLKTYTDPNIKEEIGERIFAELLRLESEIQMDSDPYFETKTHTFTAKLRKPTEEETAYARAILSGEVQETASKMRDPKMFSKMLLAVAEYPYDETQIELSCLKIGNAHMVAWPGEIFCDFGMEIRSEHPGEDFMIAELSNGSAGCYIPTKEAFSRGGYEPDLVDPLSLSEDCGNIIVAETRKML